mmetsp:Transcript_59414/g.98485  ORF Transcript_59414/g.98485 Transcript_59414/m.98485 type:complete len:214 (+) Transcript_59414:1982-2623(+)
MLRCSPCVYMAPKTPLSVGSSLGTSWFRPHRGSLAILILGDQQSRPACGLPDQVPASVAPCSQRDLSSQPMIRPISCHIEELKPAPSAFGFGNDVGHETAPLELWMQFVCTPCMQLTPQSYSGKLSRGIAPDGPGEPPPPSRAVSRGGISSKLIASIRLSTRSSIESVTSHQAFIRSKGGRQARVLMVRFVTFDAGIGTAPVVPEMYPSFDIF